MASPSVAVSSGSQDSKFLYSASGSVMKSESVASLSVAV